MGTLKYFFSINERPPSFEILLLCYANATSRLIRPLVFFLIPRLGKKFLERFLELISPHLLSILLKKKKMVVKPIAQ